MRLGERPEARIQRTQLAVHLPDQCGRFDCLLVVDGFGIRGTMRALKQALFQQPLLLDDRRQEVPLAKVRIRPHRYRHSGAIGKDLPVVPRDVDDPPMPAEEHLIPSMVQSVTVHGTHGVAGAATEELEQGRVVHADPEPASKGRLRRLIRDQVAGTLMVVRHPIDDVVVDPGEILPLKPPDRVGPLRHRHGDEAPLPHGKAPARV